MREFKEHDFGPKAVDRSENREKFPMILFKKQFIMPILRGNKSQTRRLARQRRYHKDDRYWAQTSFNPLSRFALLQLVDVREWNQQLISQDDVRREGFETEDEFWNIWHSINKDKLNDPKRVAYIINFRVVRAWRLPYYNPDLPKGAMHLA